MRFVIQLERNSDKHSIAKVTDLPGVMVYGVTRKDAIKKAQTLALRILADRIERGEKIPAFAKHFVVAATCRRRRVVDFDEGCNIMFPA